MVPPNATERLATVQALLGRGDWPQAMAAAQALHDEWAADAEASAMAAEAALVVAKATHNANQFDEALDWCRRGRAKADAATRLDLTSAFWVVTAAVEARLDRPVAAVSAIEQALAGLSDTSTAAVRRSIYFGVALSFQAMALWRPSLQAWRGAVEAERIAQPESGAALSAVNLVATAMMLYDDEQAVDPGAASGLLEELTPLAAEIEAGIPALQNPWLSLLSHHAAGSVARRLGQLPRATTLLSRAESSSLDAPALIRGVVRLELALAKERSGDLAGARVDAERACELLRREPVGPSGFITLPVLNALWRAERLAGRDGEAVALLDQLRCRSLRCHRAVLDAQSAGLVPRVNAKTLTLLNADLREANAGLFRHVEDLSRVAQSDPLTGALNRRGLEAAFSALQSSGRSVALGLLDLDHFKEVNDRHSHVVGDQVLRGLCRALGELLRTPDCVGRYGGEEFVVLLSGITEPEAVSIVERLRRHVETSEWHRLSPGLVVTFSAGVVGVRSGESFADAVQRADLVLYEAKRQGRNRVLPRAASADKAGVADAGSGAP